MNQFLTSTVDAYLATQHTGTQTVWDVGSRDGRDGVELGERCQADVTCVEANSEQAEVIRRSYPQVRVYELAASDRRGVAPFMVYEGSEGDVGSSSLDLRWKAHDHLPGHVVQVRTERLDSLVGDEQIGVMKIDVEGHSLQVLKGLGKKLRNVQVFHIETETWTHSDTRIKAFMQSHGYKLVDEQEQYLHMPDLVFVRVDPHI